MELIKGLMAEPAVQVAVIAAGCAALVPIVDYIVKWTKNDLDNTIWAKARGFFVKKAGG